MEKTPDCLPYSLNIPTPFGYRPSLVAGIIFMILFLGGNNCPCVAGLSA